MVVRSYQDDIVLSGDVYLNESFYSMMVGDKKKWEDGNELSGDHRRRSEGAHLFHLGHDEREHRLMALIGFKDSVPVARGKGKGMSA